MKKVISVAFSVFLFIIFSLNVSAEKGFLSFSCSCDKEKLSVGEDVTVTVLCSGEEQLKSIGITGVFDAELFDVKSSEWLCVGQAISAGFDEHIMAVAAFADTVYPKDICENGEIFRFVLTAKKNLDNSTAEIDIKPIVKNKSHQVETKTASAKIALSGETSGGNDASAKSDVKKSDSSKTSSSASKKSSSSSAQKQSASDDNSKVENSKEANTESENVDVQKKDQKQKKSKSILFIIIGTLILTLGFIAFSVISKKRFGKSKNKPDDKDFDNVDLK